MTLTSISGFPKIRVTIFGGPHNKDYSILGSILASPCLRNLPYRRVYLLVLFKGEWGAGMGIAMEIQWELF